MFTMVLIAGPAPSSAPAVNSPTPDVAVIEQSASTNEPGFSISVERNGTITRNDGTSRSVHNDKTLAMKLYADLQQSGNLNTLQDGHCMKSASFGTTTKIAYNGQRSPDLQCAASAIEQTLHADVQSIISTSIKDNTP